MDDLISVVRATLTAVLDLTPIRLPDRSGLALQHAHSHHYAAGAPPGADSRSCVDMLLRLLGGGGGGASEKRINSLPVVTLPRHRVRRGKKVCPSEDEEDVASEDCFMHQADAFDDPTLMFDQDTCSICLDDYEQFNVVRVLGCGHVFHARCAEEWLKYVHSPQMPSLLSLPHPTIILVQI